MTDNPHDLDLEHLLQWQRTRNQILAALAGDKRAIAENHREVERLRRQEENE